MLIFKKDVEGNVFRVNIELWRVFELDLELVSLLELMLLLGGGSIEKNLRSFDQFLEVASGVVGKVVR